MDVLNNATYEIQSYLLKEFTDKNGVINLDAYMSDDEQKNNERYKASIQSLDATGHKNIIKYLIEPMTSQFTKKQSSNGKSKVDDQTNNSESKNETSTTILKEVLKLSLCGGSMFKLGRISKSSQSNKTNTKKK